MTAPDGSDGLWTEGPRLSVRDSAPAPLSADPDAADIGWPPAPATWTHGYCKICKVWKGSTSETVTTAKCEKGHKQQRLQTQGPFPVQPPAGWHIGSHVKGRLMTAPDGSDGLWTEGPRLSVRDSAPAPLSADPDAADRGWPVAVAVGCMSRRRLSGGASSMKTSSSESEAVVEGSALTRSAPAAAAAAVGARVLAATASAPSDPAWDLVLGRAHDRARRSSGQQRRRPEAIGGTTSSCTSQRPGGASQARSASLYALVSFLPVGGAYCCLNTARCHDAGVPQRISTVSPRWYHGHGREASRACIFCCARERH